MKVRILNNAGRRHAKDETGASLIEYTVVISLFLLMFFAVLDFGRLGFNWVMTEKAIQRAARIATVRPAVCANVPETHALAAGSTSNFGTLCRVAGTCANGGVQQCVLGAANEFQATNPCTAPINVAALPNNPTQAQINARNAQLGLQTAQEMWCTLEPILPHNAAPNNIFVAYSYNDQLGFAGGPYTPMVEVSVVTAADVGTNIDGPEAQLLFPFLTPIPGLAAMAGGATTPNINTAGALPTIAYPDLSVSLPGEDLNTGNNG
ncbi:MAG: pilus assembly protein [Silicimonas sp.]|nr:pilus assembly protein [Silicimonas sp.]